MAQSDPDCLFGKIIAGELPAVLVAQDERTVAFMDINPATRGHALGAIPRYDGDPLRLPWTPGPGDPDVNAAAGAVLRGS